MPRLSPTRKNASSKKESQSSPRSPPSKRSPHAGSNEGKATKQPASKTQSLSPSRSTFSGSKNASALPPERNTNKRRQASGADNKTMEMAKLPQLTKSGLKIIDMSGQGLTSIPINVITAKDVGHLILSSNNLRSITSDIVRMKHLEKLDISKNGIRCANSNDFSGLPQELVRLTILTELIISECNLSFIPPVIFKMTNLHILDVSRNKINMLMPEIGQLVNLVKLSLHQTNITTLPPDIAYCQELEELYLWGNAIQTLPETLSEMSKIRVLALNYRSFCEVIDPYMENLLRKGQIKSEHLPTVVFELPSLEVLDLENTKLNTLPDINNTMLKELYLSKNFLQSIPQSIYNLQHLHTLDMSNNILTALPEDISRLKELKILRLAANELEMVPSSIGSLRQLEELNLSQNRIYGLPSEIKGLTALKALFLAYNKLQSLPDEICDLILLHTLDLTGNDIASLPTCLPHLSKLTTAHSYHKLVKCGLWLYKNPLVEPPPEIWRSDKPDHIFEYINNLVAFKRENLQRQKIQLLGDSQCGKTSLVRALMLRKSALSKGLKDRTRLVQHTLWKTEKRAEMVFLDFGGDSAYRIFYRWFLDSKALVMLVYNAATVCKENFYSCIGRWLDMLSANCPGAVVKIVGTQADLMEMMMNKDQGKTMPDNEHDLRPSENYTETITNTKNREITSEIDSSQYTARSTNGLTSEILSNEKLYDMVMEYLNTKEVQVSNELKTLESNIAKMKTHGTDEVNESDEVELSMMQMRVKKLKGILQKPLKILPVISIVSASESLQGILNLIDDLDNLAIDKAKFPQAWRHIPGHWKQLQLLLKQRKGLYLRMREIKETAAMFQVKEEELRDFMTYLHDTAHVLWMKDDPVLCNIVFHRPKMLVDIIASLYRHDVTDFLNYDNKLFFCVSGMTRQQFQECCEIFMTKGEISQPLLKCFLFPVSYMNDDIALLLEVLPLLDICYAVPSAQAATLYNQPLMVLPWYNKYTNMTLLTELWPAKKTDGELEVTYNFPFFYPPEIFPSLSVQIQDSVDERMDWNNCLYATSGKQTILIQQSEGTDGTDLNIQIRGTDFSAQQTLLSELVHSLNSLLTRYPGLYWKLTSNRCQ